MSKSLIFSKVALGIAALTLSTGLWASTANAFWEPVTETAKTTDRIIDDFDVFGVRHAMSGPDYLVTDKDTGLTKEFEGIDCKHNHKHRHVISHHSDYMTMHKKEMMGDKITNMRTHRSGIITGIKDQGTMEVMYPNGRSVQYQYVTFKVKPVK